MKIFACALTLVGAVSLVGCNNKPSGGPAATTSASASGGTATAADGAAYFTANCVVCHGEGGKGDGPGAAALDPKPRNFTDAKWQDSVDDEHIKKTILGGGLAVGKSPVMAGRPDLKGKDALLEQLVKHIRSFKGK
jgi:mono/diheme cytochrome c family protein